MTKRERTNREVLHRRAQVAMLSGLAAGDDVTRRPRPDRGSGSQPRARQRGKYVLRAARDLAQAGGEDGPEVAYSAPRPPDGGPHTA